MTCTAIGRNRSKAESNNPAVYPDVRLSPVYRFDEVRDDVETQADFEVREDHGPRPPHAPGIGSHYLQIGTHERSQIHLVDDQ